MDFNKVVKQYRGKIFYSCLRYLKNEEDAEDATQETFFLGWKFLDQFKGKSKISTWLHRIAINKCRAMYMKNKKFSTVCIDVVNLKDLPIIMQMFELQEMEEVVKKAVRHLGKKQKKVFTLRMFKGLKYKAIADIMETTYTHVKANFHRAKENVKDLIETELNHYLKKKYRK